MGIGGRSEWCHREFAVRDEIGERDGRFSNDAADDIFARNLRVKCKCCIRDGGIFGERACDAADIALAGYG